MTSQLINPSIEIILHLVVVYANRIDDLCHNEKTESAFSMVPTLDVVRGKMQLFARAMHLSSDYFYCCSDSDIHIHAIYKDMQRLSRVVLRAKALTTPAEYLRSSESIGREIVTIVQSITSRLELVQNPSVCIPMERNIGTDFVVALSQERHRRAEFEQKLRLSPDYSRPSLSQ